MRKTWNLIKSLIGHKTGSTDNSFLFLNDNDQLLYEVANKFNQRFSSIGKKITDNILISTNYSFQSFLNQPQLQSMSFLPTSPLEIIKSAYSLNTSHICGIDNIDPCIAHEFISLIADPLSSNFNHSFRTGIVPLELKSVKVIPLFRSGDNNFNNYRPTSILPYFSKLIEKIVHSTT